jgi:AcrR family transcriptional regulator
MNGERSTRDGLLAQLLEAFRTHGFDGVSLSHLSKATGLGKASLYHHFPGGKREMALAVMALSSAWLETEVFSALEGGGDPAVRLGHMLEALQSFYQHGEKSCLLDVMPIGGGSEVQAMVKALMQRLIAGFERLALDAGMEPAVAKPRAELALVCLQGSLVVSRGLGDAAPFLHRIESLRQGFLAAKGD